MPGTYTATLDNVGAAITSVIQPQIEDAVYDNYALFAILEAKGNIVMPDPSFDISWPVVIDMMNRGTYSGIGNFPGVEKQVLTRLVLPWKNAFVDCAVAGSDLMRASGPYAAFQLADALKQNMMMTIMDYTGELIYGDGFATDLDGMANGIDDGTLYGTYGGQSRTTYPKLKSVVDGAGATFTLPYLTSLQSRVRVGQARVDVIATTQELWDAAQNRAQTQQTFNKNDERNNVARLGFTVVSHMGADIVDDSKVPAGHMFGINTDYVKFFVHRERMWAFSGWKDVARGDGALAAMLLMGNMACTNPRMSFKSFNVTA